MMVKEIACRAVCLQPMPVKQKIMHFVGEDELLDFHALLPEPGDQIHRLREINIAIVVAMNEEHGRLPGAHGGDRRGIMSELGQLWGNVLAVPIVGWPVMHAMDVYSRRKQVGITPQSERGQVAAVASAPESDAFAVHVGAAL